MCVLSTWFTHHHHHHYYCQSNSSPPPLPHTPHSTTHLYDIWESLCQYSTHHYLALSFPYHTHHHHHHPPVSCLRCSVLMWSTSSRWVHSRDALMPSRSTLFSLVSRNRSAASSLHLMHALEVSEWEWFKKKKRKDTTISPVIWHCTQKFQNSSIKRKGKRKIWIKNVHKTEETNIKKVAKNKTSIYLFLLSWGEVQFAPAIPIHFYLGPSSLPKYLWKMIHTVTPIATAVGVMVLQPEQTWALY